MSIFGNIFRRKGGKDNVSEKEVKKSFENVKKDFSKISKWISHFDESHEEHYSNAEELDQRMKGLEDELKSIKHFIDYYISQTAIGESTNVSKQPFERLSKQERTAVQTNNVQTPVQTVVQTSVQTQNANIPALRGLTMMERVVLFVLLNSKDKLSYDDISVLSGKDRSTVRGQVNNIKRKSEGVISEIMEPNGKKRFYIDEKIKERLLDHIAISKKMPKKVEELKEKKKKSE